MEEKKFIDGWVNLNYVVEMVKMDLEDYSTHQQKRLLQYAIFTFNDLNLYVSNDIRTEYLELDRTNSVPLPHDYMEYVAIGIKRGGRFYAYTNDESLVLPRQEECGQMQPEDYGCTSDDVSLYYGGYWSYYGSNYYYFAPHYSSGQWVGGLYGVSGGVGDGRYRVDHEKRRITIGGHIPDDNKILLEYKSSGVRKDGQTVVPRAAVPVLRSRIHYERVAYDSRFPAGEKQRLWRMYEIEYQKYLELEGAFTVEEYFDRMRQNDKRSPKR